MLKTAHWFQWVIAALFGAYLGWQFIAAGQGDPDDSFHFREFGSLPVQENGRTKPFDTVARAHLMIIDHRQTLKDDRNGTVYPATKWMLDTMLPAFTNRRSEAMDQKIFRIENPEVLGLLHLDPRPGKWRYAFAEFHKRIPNFFAPEVEKALLVPERDRTLFQAKVVELSNHLHLFLEVAKLSSPGIVPVQGEEWLSFKEVALEARNGQPMPPLATHFEKMMVAYGDGDVKGFNEDVKLYRSAFDQSMPEVMNKARLEVYFNEVAPFFHCAALYVVIFVLGCVSWLAWFPVLNRGAFWGMALVVLVHLWALVVRMVLQDRLLVFVTNLYSSAVFIGLGCALTCLVVEYFYRNGIALAVGSATGAMSLVVAHMLSLDSGDTMEMMQAVLDTNFWLMTHVTCVTMGYTATFVAGFMGVAYVFAMCSSAALGLIARRSPAIRHYLESPESTQGPRGFFTRFFATDASAVMGRMLYGIVCFGMFLSFTGTVLGGLWADYSWGRFWGWDPKENGALLIVIWCALILHARWAGIVKQRGIAILAVIGNVITAWSWFGTNFLGIGLHSYGFMQGAMFGLLAFDAVMLTIAGIGLLPLRQWARLPPRAAARAAV